MKKLLFIFSVFVFIGINANVKGQTAIQIMNMTDSIGNYCNYPIQTTFFLHAQLSGYPNGSVFEIEVNFGDGTDTTFYQLNWSSNLYSSISHTFLFPGSFSVLTQVKGPDFISDTFQTQNQIVITDTCCNVKGKIYKDLNGSCTFDANDEIIPYAMVKILSGTNLVSATYTNNLGNFSMNVPSGQNFNLEIVDNQLLDEDGFILTCSNSGTVNFNSNSNQNFNFPYSCNNGFDLRAKSIWHLGAVPGIVRFFYPSFSIGSCEDISGTLEIELDPLQSFAFNNGIAPTTINGNTVSWDFNNLNHCNVIGFLQAIGKVYTLTDSTANIGDSVCHVTNVYPISGDANASNNSFTSCTSVTASFDPNLKEVAPAGAGLEGIIANNQTMTYTVQFQNTGTAPAQNVFILDTLDADLDLNALQILSSSHDMNLYTTINGILKFDFPNIQLPDSNANEPLSHGYVMYQIDQKPNLFPGTEIKNTAHIFFDYNDVVITNTTLNTIEGVDGVEENNYSKISVFPNPADDLINISGEIQVGSKFIISDISGKIILNGEINERLHINSSGLSNGIYFISIESEGKKITNKIEIIR